MAAVDDSQLEVVESFLCLECGAACAVSRRGDLLLADCPNGCRRYALTVAPAGEVAEGGPDPLVGQSVGPCRVMARLGCEGGEALYGGLDVALNQSYSLLVLRGEAARDPERVQAFVRMGKLAAAARHAALANVTQLGRLPDGLFAVAPALEGRPVEGVLGPGQEMGLAAALKVGRRLADALAALHARGIVHRNIGPRTVYLLPDGEPLLRNFAFAIGPGTPADPKLVVGQAGYIAPEILAARGADHRADLFSLGALLYLVLTGGPVFAGAGPAETIASQKAGAGDLRTALEGRAPPEVADVVVAMLAENPAERPPDATAVLDVLAGAKPPERQAETAPTLGFDEAELAVLEPTSPAHQAPPAEQPPTEKEGARDFLDLVSKPPEPHAPPEGPEVEGPAGVAAAAVPAPEPTPLSPEEERQLRLAPEHEPEAESEPAEEQEEPERWTPQRKVLAAVGGAVALVVVVWFAWLAFFSASKPPPRTPEVRKKVPRKRKPTPEERAEADAKVELARLELFAKKRASRPAEVVAQCDEFLKKFARTSSAAEVRKLRAKAQEDLRGIQAKAELAKFRSLFRDPKTTHEQKLKAVATFLATYQGTEAAKELAKQRDDYTAGREADARRMVERLRRDLHANLEAGAYGKAIAALEPVVSAYRDTKAGSAAARQLADLKAKLAAEFAACKEAARELVRECRFAEAIAKFGPALEVWDAPDYQQEAARITQLIRARRRKVVADYATLLQTFRERVTSCRFAEALEVCRQAEAKADHAAMKALVGGLRSDAELLTRLPARIVAGAKAQAAEAAKTDGRIWLQRKLGKFKALVKAVEADGIVVEMPGLKGKVAWGQLPPEQLVAFARSAPGKPGADDHRAVGLLALTAGLVEAAYEEFDAAAEADPAAADRVRASLSRLLGGFVHIPPGKFYAGRKNEQVELPGYFLASREVTNAEYAFYLKATGRAAPPDWKNGAYPRGYGEFPLVNVTWQEAAAYATWLGARLPTALEWERAVRGPDGKLYPWGDEFDPSRVNFARKTAHGTYSKLIRATRHLTRRDSSPFFHLLGNAREWTATAVGRSRDGKTTYAVVGGGAPPPPPRGGGGGPPPHGPKAMVPYQYGQQQADARDPFTGFRLAWPR